MERNSLMVWGVLLGLARATLELPAAETAGDLQGRPSVRHKGALVIAGGGDLGADVMGRFLALAGGPDAPMVVIPTAGEGNSFADNCKGVQVLKAAGARNVVLLHTRKREEADSEAFVKPLQRASGVWISGGRQWRLRMPIWTRWRRENCAPCSIVAV
jgi:cyanophycinase